MVARECLLGSMNTLCIHWSMTPLVLRSSSVNSHQEPRHWLSEWFWAAQKQHMSSITEEGKQWCHPPDACCTNLSQNFKLFKRLSIRACRSHTKMQSIINFMWLCCSESLLCFSWYERLGLWMASSSFSFLVLRTLWASQICNLREEKKWFVPLESVPAKSWWISQPLLVPTSKMLLAAAMEVTKPWPLLAFLSNVSTENMRVLPFLAKKSTSAKLSCAC